MDMFLVNQDSEAAMSCMRKIAKQAKEGAMIPLTKEEYNAFTGGYFHQVSMDSNSNGSMKIAQVKKGMRYVIIADEDKTNLEDVVNIGKRLQIKTTIVRTRS